ncbi:hypothetical protein SK854_20155 [Lentzea sp. BCCO 10_0061]|uniref:Lipoprotein n=1 Tax=Lentzea sokolovensis TaxID=3095429 RepID=A0ABU4UY24_9PSEU|nr:hypothetical protein [Lentzea sp. BCCO 10_0061]MDX8144442.1 hypothetical protein [Lentzea sp. BCCO 10_0061]
MRKIIAALAACLVLAGCGLGRWEGEIRFNVTSINNCYKGYSDVICATRIYLDVVGDLPAGAPGKSSFKGAFVEPDDFEDESKVRDQVAVGDEIICVGQEQSEGFEYLNGNPLELSKCRMA